MAKRRRLSVPDVQKLQALDAEFEAMPTLETKSAVPPIAQVAGDAAARMEVADAETRVARESDKVDAAKLRDAKSAGLLVSELSLKDINADYLSRDRVELDREELDELKASIRNHGQRTPIEVMEVPDGFGLISGWRRLRAFVELHAESGEADFSRIHAFIRVPETATKAYVAMVEENEIRADLSHYERGRVAAVGATQGLFSSVDDAVNQLFSAASKAKRSKIRSFARIHEVLGDLLSFPTYLSERNGLALAAGLRTKGAEPFRDMLAGTQPKSANQEWAMLNGVIAEVGTPKTNERGGRPARGQFVEAMEPLPLISGGAVTADLFEDRIVITLTEQKLNSRQARKLLNKLRTLADQK